LLSGLVTRLRKIRPSRNSGYTQDLHLAAPPGKLGNCREGSFALQQTITASPFGRAEDDVMTTSFAVAVINARSIEKKQIAPDDIGCCSSII